MGGERPSTVSITAAVLAAAACTSPTCGDRSGEERAGTSRRPIVVLGDHASGPLLANMLQRAGAVDVAVLEDADRLRVLLGEGVLPTVVVDAEATDPWAPVRLVRARGVAVGIVLLALDAEAVEEKALELGVAEVLEWDEVDGGRLLRACRRAAWRVRERERLVRLARRDPGSGLATSVVLRDRLATALAAARRRDSRFALFHLLLGRGPGAPETGRLGALADLLVRRLRRSDTVARLGPAELAVLVEDLRRPEDAVTVARKVEEAAEEIALRAGEGLFAGVALGAGDTSGCEDLPEQALRAAERARAEGTGFVFADPGFDRRARELLQLARDLAVDLGSGRLGLVLRPQLNLQAGPIGLEVGFSWRHPRRGVLAGSALGEVAAAGGLQEACAFALLERAAACGGMWYERGLRGFHLVVALPPHRALRHLDLSERLADLCDRHRLAAAVLELELDEAHLLEVLDDPAGFPRLPAAVRLAVGAFGRGPASLRLLWEVPLDTVRLAAGWTQALPGRNEPPLHEVIRLVRAAGRRTVAEIDDASRMAELRRIGCDAVRWFRGSPALEEAQARAWLERALNP